MIPLVNAMSVVGGPSGKTVEDWLAHIATRTPATASPAANVYGGDGSFLARVQFSPSVVNGYGYGSTWGYFYAGIFEVAMIHSMISAAAAMQQKTNSGTVLFAWDGIYYRDYIEPVNRNGIRTEGYDLPDNPGSFRLFNEVSYWDYTLGKPMRMNPYSSFGPVDYSAAGWPLT